MTRAIFSLLLLAALAGCESERKTAAPPPEIMRNVSVMAVQTAQVPDRLEALGNLRAGQEAEIASQMMGNIVDIRVHEGDRVRRGQLIASIDAAQPQAALERAKAAAMGVEQELAAATADLNLAESTQQRYQKLYDKKSVSPQEFDEVQTRYRAALARRDMAQANQSQAKAAVVQAQTFVGYGQIHAPFDGVITAKKSDTGTLVSPGQVLFTLEDTGRYRLEATVNENELQFVHSRQTVPVVIDALNAEFPGKVVEIVPAADPASRTFLVKIEVPIDPRLRSGLFGRAQFVRGQRASLLIPRTAVIDRGQLLGVFVVDQNQIATLRYVSLGETAGDAVEVLAGLQHGERLVSEPGALDLSGKRIEIRQ